MQQQQHTPIDRFALECHTKCLGPWTWSGDAGLHKKQEGSLMEKLSQTTIGFKKKEKWKTNRPNNPRGTPNRNDAPHSGERKTSPKLSTDPDTLNGAACRFQPVGQLLADKAENWHITYDCILTTPACKQPQTPTTDVANDIGRRRNAKCKQREIELWAHEKERFCAVHWSSVVQSASWPIGWSCVKNSWNDKRACWW